MSDFSKFDKFIADADKDDRLGDQDAMVTAVEETAWPSGDPFKRVKLALTAVNNAKVDFNLNPLPTDEELAGSAGWTAAKKKGVAGGIQLLKALDKFYGKSADTLAEGDTIRVKVVKNKEGFLRVVAILDPKAAKAEPGAAKAKSDIPF